MIPQLLKQFTLTRFVSVIAIIGCIGTATATMDSRYAHADENNTTHKALLLAILEGRLDVVDDRLRSLTSIPPEGITALNRSDLATYKARKEKIIRQMSRADEPH